MKLLALATFSLAATAAAAPIPERLAVRAIIGEASGEGYQGMTAIACALRNRGSLKGVQGLRAPHIPSQPTFVWQLARRAWYASSTMPDITNGATHWDNTHIRIPAWSLAMTPTLTLGHHTFYRRRTTQP